MNRSLSYIVPLARSLAILVAGCLSLDDVIAGNAQEPAIYPNQTSAANVEELIRFLDGELAQPYELSTRPSIGQRREFALATDQGYTLVEPAFFQPQPVLTPAPSSPMAPSQPNQAQSISASLFGTFGVPRSTLLASATTPLPSSNVVLGAESKIRVTTDIGNLLGKSPAVIGVGMQRRNPVVTDPRIRSNRVGSLAASGSYWVPARIDLDTVLSKIDSRIIEKVTVVKGPYTALYGPGMEFVNFELLNAPRYVNGLSTDASSTAVYKTNGDQWYGRQAVSVGEANWGVRLGYGHRTGSDYRSGNGKRIPSSYKSRDVDLAFGWNPSRGNAIDGHYLRLDQTDVELPGQAFDIDVLVTDGFDLTFVWDDTSFSDEFRVNTWYNRTDIQGSAQRSGKRETFPFFDEIGFDGTTDIFSVTTGISSAASWGMPNDSKLTAGTDLRYVEQELSEITSGILGGFPFDNVNAPIPHSHQTNPGLFAEYSSAEGSYLGVKAGGRIDYVSSDVDESTANLQTLGIFGQSASDILGSGQFKQNELLGLGYLAIDRSINKNIAIGANVGYAERAPNLTERYAVQPFMFLLQNGLNTVTGDPELNKERTIQTDVRMTLKNRNWRSRTTLFHKWAYDYITFENFGVESDAMGNRVQVNLKYVNTELAVFQGVENRSEIDLLSKLTAFSNLRYVQGDDRRRDGKFATVAADGFGSSERFPGLARGEFNGDGITAASKEPLPSILPLEATVGVRIGDQVDDPRWGIELSTRIVDNQDRIARSLLETPTPGFSIWNLRGFWNPSPSLTLIGGVENFTNKNYREHLDFRSLDLADAVFQPGMNFYFSGELTY